MKTTTYICDKCKKPIDGKYQKEVPRPSDLYKYEINGGELCTLHYEGIMGHNKFPREGLHYHYDCFCEIMNILIN